MMTFLLKNVTSRCINDDTDNSHLNSNSHLDYIWAKNNFKNGTTIIFIYRIPYEWEIRASHISYKGNMTNIFRRLSSKNDAVELGSML